MNTSTVDKGPYPDPQSWEQAVLQHEWAVSKYWEAQPSSDLGPRALTLGLEAPRGDNKQ